MTVIKHVALLRGINVGRSKRIAMGHLRDLFHGLGYVDAVMHLQSGNVVFSASTEDVEDLAPRVEKRIDEQMGLRVRVLVRDRDELRAVVADNPKPAWVADPARFLVAFLSTAPDPVRLRQVTPAGFAPELFHCRGRHIYLWIPDGFRMTKLTQDVWERQLAVTATTRNWNTVARLAELTAG